MKIRSLWCGAVLVSIIFLGPFSSFGQEYVNDLALKAGIYAPNGNLDDFDVGFSGELAYGRYVAPNLKMELGLGYFECDGSFDRLKTGLGQVSEENELSVIPITVTAKVVLPSNTWEAFGGVGFGFYLADFKSQVNRSSLGSFTLDDSDTAFGAHFVAGANYNFSKRWYIGFEGKYVFTTKVRFEGTASGSPVAAKGDLDGMLATVLVGYRF
jgi:outer membrane protein W